jgi:hypothetical protein
MVSVMVPPTGTLVKGVNMRTIILISPATPPEVIEVKEVIVVPSTMATNVPVVLVSLRVPEESAVAAAMVVDAT